MNRRIVIRRLTVTGADDMGSEITEYRDDPPIFARLVTRSIAEALRGGQTLQTQERIYRTRHLDRLASVTNRDRIYDTHDGRECEIVGVRQMDRRRGVNIDARAIGGGPVEA